MITAENENNDNHGNDLNSNGNNNNNQLNGESTEETALISSTRSGGSEVVSDTGSNNGGSSIGGGSSNGDSNDPISQILWDEQRKPWPATFERSISLLASPMINKDQADLYTKSPKPGNTPLAQRRQNRGDLTPEPGIYVKGSSIGSDGKLFQPIIKTQSLDYAATKYGSGNGAAELEPLSDTLMKAHKSKLKKVDAAKEYRKKLLQQKQDEKNKKKQKTDVHGGVESIESKATFSQCVFNMSNILMGIGLLELPFALKVAGWFGGLLSVLVLGIITWRTSILIGRELNGDPRPLSLFHNNKNDNSRHSSLSSSKKGQTSPDESSVIRMRPQISSFPDIARTAYGEFGSVIVSVVLYFELFSCVSIFFVAIGDHLHALYPQLPFAGHALIAAAISLIPTIFLHNARLLSYFSMIGTFATIVVVLTVFFSAVVEGDISEEVAMEADNMNDSSNNDEPTHIFFKPAALPIAMGLVAYCFSGHAIVPNIYNSMQEPQQFERMITVSFTIVIGSCCLVGASGYYMFGSSVLDQVTLSLEQHSSATFLMLILTWLMVLTAFSKVTLTLFPLSLGLEEIISPYLTSDAMSHVISSVIKLVITALAYLVAVYFPSFSYLCALVGMICTMSVSVIFPAAAHYTLFKEKLTFLDKFTDVIFILFGIFIAIVGTVYELS